MIGRRMITATAVLAAVAAGGVSGAVIGIPGSSGASTTATDSASSTTTMPGASPQGHEHGPRGFFGPAIGADKGVLDAAAKALDLSTKDLLSKLSDGKTTIADVASQQHVNVADVIKAMEAVADTDISNLVNNPFPARPAFKGGPEGMPGARPAFGPGLGIGFGRPDSFAAVAKVLGTSVKDLMTDLRNGQSIADIAKSKNVDVDTLINTLVTDATSKIDAAVKAGHFPKDAATKIESGLKDMITNLVNNTPQKLDLPPFGFGHFGGRGRHFWPGGPDNGAPTSSAPATSTSNGSPA